MNENFVLTNGNEIAFISDIYRPNGLRTQISPEALYTKHGFLIPLGPWAFNLIAYFEGDDSQEGMSEGALRGWLITPSGRIEEWSTGDKAGVRRMLKRLVPWGPGVVGIRGGYVETEETLFAAMDFHDNDIRKALALASDTLREGPAPIHIMSIPAIVEELNKRFPQKG